MRGCRMVVWMQASARTYLNGMLDGSCALLEFSVVPCGWCWTIVAHCQRRQRAVWTAVPLGASYGSAEHGKYVGSGGMDVRVNWIALTLPCNPICETAADSAIETNGHGYEHKRELFYYSIFFFHSYFPIIEHQFF